MKTYVIEGTELIAFRTWVDSEKPPEDFDSIEEFYSQADSHGDWKTIHGEVQSLESVEVHDEY